MLDLRSVSDFFMDIHDKWKYPKCNIFCNIMQDSVYKSNNPIYTTCTFISSTMLLDGYTETTLELHWKATGWIHWKYTEIPLHLQRTPTAPPAHLNCTSSAPQLHLQRTPTAPPAHLKCTSSAPQLHLQQCTSNSAPPSTPTSFTYLHPHLQRTPTAPLSTTAFTNPC